MSRSPLSFRPVRHVSVVATLLIVALAPRVARAQSSEASAVVTVRHTLTAELGAVMQARWLPFVRDARTQTTATGSHWSTSGRVRSNVPVIALVEMDGDTPRHGWWLRDTAGRLQPWDGRATAVSAPLGPGEADIDVQLVAPDRATAEVPSVRLRVIAAPRR